MQEWEDYWDDIIFLKHLKKIAYIDVNNTSEADVRKLRNEVTNSTVFDISENEYFVGYSDI